MAVDISYQCLPSSNNCVFRIFHHTYYDCAGAATSFYLPPNTLTAQAAGLSPSNFSFEPSTCTTPFQTGAWTLISWTEATPICGRISTRCTDPNASINGVMEARFYGDFNFCNTNCSSYTVIWANCCRNTTITSTGSIGIYTGVTKIDLSLSSCNNSPLFSAPIVPYICAGDTTIISLQAFDPDGDSLAYSMVTCGDNSTNAISYATGYSLSDPLGSSWDVSLDSLTGLLHFMPNPGNVVVAVLCVEVREYRNGVEIGKVLRDMQVTVVNCPNNSLPQLDSVKLLRGGQRLNTLHYAACFGKSLSWVVYASEPDTGQVIQIDTIAGYANFSQTRQIGRSIVDTITFTPATPGTKYIPLVFRDNNCPLKGEISHILQLDVLANCLTAQVTDPPCSQAQGMIDLTVLYGTPPYRFLWSTGDTTEDLSGLTAGSYHVRVTDADGSVFQDSFFVNTSLLSIQDSIVAVNCTNLNSGAITTSMSGGTIPYSYSWSTGDTTQNLSQLGSGLYRLFVRDAAGCEFRKNYIVERDHACFGEVYGYVFRDLNNNCIKDIGESGIPYVLIDLGSSMTNSAVLTDSNGFYSFQALATNATVEVVGLPSYVNICPSSYFLNIVFPGFRYPRNFAIRSGATQDLAIQEISSIVRPGKTAYHELSVTNRGNSTMSGQVQWTHDSLFTLDSSSIATTSYSAISNMASWSFSNLPPLGSQSFRAYTQIDTQAQQGDIFINQSTASPIIGDNIASNNFFTNQGKVRASFDTNTKSVLPQGIGTKGYISQAEQKMTYTLRFQNTGTDTAFYVVIRDTLDKQLLDVLSFQHEMTSHPYPLNLRVGKNSQKS